MKRLVVWVESFALSIGGPGLFFVAFLDSSFLSLPEINDLLVILLVTRHKERLLYYAGMATAGSIAGCWVLYLIGRKGGEALLRRRFREQHVDRVLARFNRYGAFAVLVPAILPPPAPFKIFVLMAGVAKVPAWPFALAVGIGRGFRYFTEGLLAVWYGEAAVVFLHEHGRKVSIGVAAAVVAAGLLYLLWRRQQHRRAKALRHGAL